MASDQEFMDFVMDQLEAAGDIHYKRMFGEYGVYQGNKIIALVCDNKLFFKPTESGREFIGQPREAPPYPGARNFFLIEEQLEDREWLCKLINISVKELPELKPKKKKEKKAKKAKKSTQK